MPIAGHPSCSEQYNHSSAQGAAAPAGRPKSLQTGAAHAGHAIESSSAVLVTRRAALTSFNSSWLGMIE